MLSQPASRLGFGTDHLQRELMRKVEEALEQLVRKLCTRTTMALTAAFRAWLERGLQGRGRRSLGLEGSGG